MTESGKNFWHTVPGVITAVAALITALGGVFAILVQNDMLGGASPEGSIVTGTPGGGGANQAVSEVTPPPLIEASPLLIPWDRATATLVRQDGTSATVKAATVSMACNTGNLTFMNGLRIRMELIRSVQFDAIYLSNASADGVVTLLDERELTDPIHTWNCPVTGANELGSFEIPLSDIRRVDFHR